MNETWEEIDGRRILAWPELEDYIKDNPPPETSSNDELTDFEWNNYVTEVAWQFELSYEAAESFIEEAIERLAL